MGSKKGSVKLSETVDEFGFYNGHIIDWDGKYFRLNILPPLNEWKGETELTGYKPDTKAWIIYIDNMEYARVEHLELMKQNLARLLTGQV